MAVDVAPATPMLRTPSATSFEAWGRRSQRSGTSCTYIYSPGLLCQACTHAHFPSVHSYIPVSQQLSEDFCVVDPDLTRKQRMGVSEVAMLASERRLVAMLARSLMMAQYRVLSGEERRLSESIQPHMHLPTRVDWASLEGGILDIVDPYAEKGVQAPEFGDKV